MNSWPILLLRRGGLRPNAVVGARLKCKGWSHAGVYDHASVEGYSHLHIINFMEDLQVLIKCRARRR